MSRYNGQPNYRSHKKMATMTDDPIQVEINRRDALESFSVDSQSQKNNLDKQLVTHME